jgi:hypothetical protein
MVDTIVRPVEILGRFYQKEEPVAVINEAMKQVFKVLKIA